MEYLQYKSKQFISLTTCRFKPYYKWNTFNTIGKGLYESIGDICFKPYYKWNTFNTTKVKHYRWLLNLVLNLIINGIPSILIIHDFTDV